MMHDVVEIDLRNLEQIPIPVDVHVARATLSLGCLRGAYSGTISGIFADIDDVWREACEDLPYYRLQMDEPLWHLSKYGCTSRIDNLCSKKLTCPVGDLCAPGTVYVSSERVEVNTSIEDRSA